MGVAATMICMNVVEYGIVCESVKVEVEVDLVGGGMSALWRVTNSVVQLGTEDELRIVLSSECDVAKRDFIDKVRISLVIVHEIYSCHTLRFLPRVGDKMLKVGCGVAVLRTRYDFFHDPVYA